MASRFLNLIGARSRMSQPGEKRSFLSGFGTTHVWDVSQTEQLEGADPMPESPTMLLTDGEGDETLRLALVAQIEGAGFTCSDGDPETVSAGANGYTDFVSRRVVIGADLPLAQRVKTTAHELAHVLLHDPSDPDLPARSIGEVEAESVAYVVCHAAGLDAGDYSFGYVAGWSGGNVDVVEAVAKRVARTAGKVLEAMTVETVSA